MSKIQVIFVTPYHGGILATLIKALINGVTGSRFSHVAIFLLNGIYEAKMPEIMISPKDEYAKEIANGVAEVLEFQVSDDELHEIESRARDLLKADCKYGIRTTIVGGLATLFGRNTAWVASKILFINPGINDCSSTVAYLLLGAHDLGKYLEYMGVTEEGLAYVTPQSLYSVLKAYNLNT